MRRPSLALAAAALVVLGACSSDDGDDDAGAATTGATGSTVAAIDAARCERNQAAGTMTYLSGFDFAASAGIVNMVVADAKGYFDDLCLDVELRSSFSTANYPLVAAGEAAFASAGSFSETLDFAQRNGAELVVVEIDSHTGIDALVTKDPAADLESLRGQTIGVKGKITPSVKAMLFQAGLVEDEDYDTVLLDGFDPKAHIAQPVAGFPVYKSNEPGQLERAGIPFGLFDPAESGIPGSFGVTYTSRAFYEEHPEVVRDVVRASLRGLQDALADPQEAVALCLERIRAGGNKSFLSDEGETFRWQIESELVAQEQPPGVPDPTKLVAEVTALAAAGVFETLPSIEGTFDGSVAGGLYDASGRLVWPG